MNGEGIKRLIIVGDEEQHRNYPNKFLYTYNKNIADGLTATFKECMSIEKYGLSEPEDLIKKLPQYNSNDKPKDVYKYIRYDYIGQEFVLYRGKFEGEVLHTDDLIEFEDITNDSVLRKDSSGSFIVLSGKEIMEQEWFKWSEVYIFSKKKTKNKSNIKEDLLELAREQLLEFLKSKDFIGEKARITKNDRDVIIKAELERLAEIHGYENLGYKKGFQVVGKVLKKFDIQIEEVGKAEEYQTFKLIDLRIRG